MKIQKKEQRGRKRKGFMNFEWSKEKADLNLMKHNVTFEEASSVFDDPLSKIFDDASNSYVEIREKIIGFSKKGRLLFVSFTERQNRLRIISAREATKNERKNYEEDNI